MQIWLKKLKNQFKNGAYLGLTILFVSMWLGCASTHPTTKTETTVSTTGDQQNSGVVDQSETTTTTTETKAEHPGVISATFHAIGYVISIPFIIIGGLFRIIFGG
ncbi:MAG: hypothetical protein Q7S13_05515 [Candidatus Omnitrophota bacterium]|nr:hypothetical protein [Candidatus Omnitrophota bacterium]